LCPLSVDNHRNFLLKFLQQSRK